MHFLLYAIIALCGLAAGWGLGAEVAGWLVLPSIVAAALAFWLLVRSPDITTADPSSSLAPAHRAWFSSSAACMAVLGLSWALFGWTMPSLSLDGIRLDPAGALGWDSAWMTARLSSVKWLLGAGALGMTVALVRCAQQKRKGARPCVRAGWAVAPFFWMASLGLLMGVSHPWRQAPAHEMADRWAPSLAPSAVSALADEALEHAASSASSAIWAHALALKAYQKKAWDRPRLDAFFNKLASINAHRAQSWLFPESALVGVDKKEWCFVNASASNEQAQPVSEIASSCASGPVGRMWEWSAR